MAVISSLVALDPVVLSCCGIWRQMDLADMLAARVTAGAAPVRRSDRAARDLTVTLPVSLSVRV